MCEDKIIVGGIVLLCLFLLVIPLFTGKKVMTEGYIDPIYPNRKKIMRDWYPRANCSIYGKCSNVLTGFPFYPKAY